MPIRRASVRVSRQTDRSSSVLAWASIMARTLTTLVATRASALAEGDQALGKAVADLLAAAVKGGSVRDDVGVGAVMITLCGVCATYDQPGWRAHADGAITLMLDGLRRH